MANTTVLLIEAFYTGSHKQLIDLLHREVPGTELVTLPGKKWHWKARTSALWLSQAIPREHAFKTLFTSSVLNLAELTALRPDLAGLHKVMYFHENQLVYPVRKQQDRDFQYGYNQILSSMVADVVLFNSKHNMETFLNNINSHLKLIPDHRPKGLVEQIKPKCLVLHFPIVFPSSDELQSEADEMLEETVQSKDEFSDNEMDTSGVNSKKCADKDNCVTESILTTDIDSEACHLCEENERTTENIICCTVENHEKLLPVKLEASRGISDNNKCFEMKERDTKCTTQKFKTEHREGKNACEESPTKKSKLMGKTGPLHILWPHRWEHDKDPEAFFKVLTQLHNDGLDFRVSVLGETYTDVPGKTHLLVDQAINFVISKYPGVFEEGKEVLKGKILHWGFLPSKEQYYRVLKSADCVVSTALHEFFGVAMLEAAHLGCYPLCPNRLVYPEIFPKECLYNTEQQLFKKLREYCKKPYIVRQKGTPIDTNQYTWKPLKDQFLKFLM